MINTSHPTTAHHVPAVDEKNQFLRELELHFQQTHSTSEIFFELTEYLKEPFSISKSVLVIIDDQSMLSAISTWHNGLRHDGLALNLPHADSLFEKVLEHGRPYTELFPQSFSGNFFERKLLLDSTSKSFALHPLKRDGRTIGLIGFSSENSSALALLEEGSSVEIISRFAELISKPD
jgi:hypothetical protein